MNLNQKLNEAQKEELLRSIFWLRIALILCLWLASYSVLQSFINLFSYLLYLGDHVDQNRYEEWHNAMQEISRQPWIFLGLNLYNTVIWLSAILLCIWLFRFHHWSRKALLCVLGFDMIFTFVQVMWEAAQGTLSIANPEWFIFLNVFQVGIIAALSHQRIKGLTEFLATQRKHPNQVFEK